MQFTDVSWSAGIKKKWFGLIMTLGGFTIFSFVSILAMTWALIKVDSEIRLLSIFVILFLSIMPTVISLNFFIAWNRVKNPYQLINYTISEKGLKVNDNSYTFKEFNKPKTLEIIKNNELPYTEWYKSPQNLDELLQIKLPIKGSEVTLFFIREVDRQKCIRSIKDYLNETTV